MLCQRKKKTWNDLEQGAEDLEPQTREDENGQK